MFFTTSSSHATSLLFASFIVPSRCVFSAFELFSSRRSGFVNQPRSPVDGGVLECRTSTLFILEVSLSRVMRQQTRNCPRVLVFTSFASPRITSRHPVSCHTLCHGLSAFTAFSSVCPCYIHASSTLESPLHPSVCLVSRRVHHTITLHSGQEGDSDTWSTAALCGIGPTPFVGHLVAWTLVGSCCSSRLFTTDLNVSASSIPSLSITLDGIPQVPSKRKHNSVDRNSVMRPSATSSTPWCICILPPYIYLYLTF